MHCIVYYTEIERISVSATLNFLWSTARYMSHLCRADLFLHSSLAFGTALLSNSWPLKKTLTCYPSSLFLCLSNLCVSPTMTLVQVSSLASHRSSWTIPFPHLSPSSTRLTLQIFQASLLIFHPPLPHMARSPPTPFLSFPSLKSSPCQSCHSSFLNPAFPR